MPYWRTVLVAVVALASLAFYLAQTSPSRPHLDFPKALDLWVDFKGNFAVHHQPLDSPPTRRAFRLTGTWRGIPSSLHKEALYTFSWERLTVLDRDGRILFAFHKEPAGHLRYQVGPHLSEQERGELYDLMGVDLAETESYSDNSLLWETWRILLGRDGKVLEVTPSPRLSRFLLGQLGQHPLSPYLNWFLGGPSHLPPLFPQGALRDTWVSDQNLFSTIMDRRGDHLTISSRARIADNHGQMTLLWDYDQRQRWIPHADLEVQLAKEKEILGHQIGYHLKGKLSMDCRFQPHTPAPQFYTDL